MAYIANKPIRFDKDYKIGEIIPDEVIDTKMEKRLISWGKIIKTETSYNSSNAPGTPEPETSEPETSESETSEPEISEPETPETKTSEPEISETKTPEPEKSDNSSNTPENKPVKTKSLVKKAAKKR